MLNYEKNEKTGCRNVSHCKQQQSYSWLRSPGNQTQPFEMTPGFKPFIAMKKTGNKDMFYMSQSLLQSELKSQT